MLKNAGRPLWADHQNRSTQTNPATVHRRVQQVQRHHQPVAVASVELQPNWCTGRNHSLRLGLRHPQLLDATPWERFIGLSALAALSRWFRLFTQNVSQLLNQLTNKKRVPSPAQQGHLQRLTKTADRRALRVHCYAMARLSLPLLLLLLLLSQLCRPAAEAVAHDDDRPPTMTNEQKADFARLSDAAKLAAHEAMPGTLQLLGDAQFVTMLTEKLGGPAACEALGINMSDPVR